MEELSEIFEKLSFTKPSTDSQPINEILQRNLNSNISKMTQTFKAEYLNCLPEFDGNPNELNRYISISESLINNFYDHSNPNKFENTYLMNSIISKLKGNAKIVVSIQNTATWEDLKTVLTRNFADQRDECCLNRDLVMLRQLPNEKPQQFFDKCLNILNLLCSYVDIHESTTEAKNLKKNLYQDIALKTFMSGLREPLGTTIRCMKPSTLGEALQYVISEDNIHYFQNFSSNKNIFRPPVAQIQQFRQQMPQVPRPNFGSSQNLPLNSHTQNNQFRQNTFPSQPINIRPNPNYQQPKFFTNSQVFKTPSTVNVFKPNPGQSFPPPTPMSVSTRNTTDVNRAGPSTSNQYRNNFSNQNQNRNYFSNVGKNPNIIVEELFNTEANQEETYDQNIEYSEPQDYEEFNVNYQDINETEIQTDIVSNVDRQNFHDTPTPNQDT